MDFETRAIHEGQEPDPATGAVTVPIYQTSTFAQDAVGQNKGYDYARSANPTRTALQICLASLESAEHGVAFASGMAAVTTVMHLVHPSERIVSVNDVYGGVYRLLSQVYEPKGYDVTFLSSDQINDGLAEHLDEQTRIVWLESPTNPLLNVIDIEAAAKAAHEVGAIVVVDNTFASPYLQRPLELGADIVLHSTTKYIGGHSDLIGGFVATNDPTIAERLYFLQKSLGAVPGPFDSWLALRGLKTLALRMERHSANARRVAEYLESHQSVEKVFYPGLPRPSRPRDREAPDEGLRRDDLVPRRLRGGSDRAGRAHEDLDAGRVARRRREPDRAPGADDACVDGGVAVPDPEEPHTALGRHRVGGRSDRRSRSRARPLDCDSRRVGTVSLPDPLDLQHQGAERVIGVYVLETTDGPALFDCGPTSCLPALKDGARRAGAGAHRPAPPAPVAHSSRPCGRRGGARP